jgi:hypothetical protein
MAISSLRPAAAAAVVDIVFLRQEIFKQIPRQAGALVMAVTHNTTFYTHGDATNAALGTHGVDSVTAIPVLASYLRNAPAIVEDRDIQPLTQRLAQFFKDPLFDPLVHGRNVKIPGNVVPGWLRRLATGRSGALRGRHRRDLFLLQPVNTNLKNVSRPSPLSPGPAGHLASSNRGAAALVHRRVRRRCHSFPNSQILTERAQSCSPSSRFDTPPMPKVSAIPQAGAQRHKMIGYWIAYGPAGLHIPLRKSRPSGTLSLSPSQPGASARKAPLFHTHQHGHRTVQGRHRVSRRNKKVIVSLGGGGRHFTLNDPKRVPNYIASVTRIVTEYGFDGVDIDFESPSLSSIRATGLPPSTTPSIVNLISALPIARSFRARFMISLFRHPDPSGYPSYGGQFGSYLAIAHGIRDILSFMDTQDYNTRRCRAGWRNLPPGSVDYHAAMTELVLHATLMSAAIPSSTFPAAAEKIAISFSHGRRQPSDRQSGHGLHHHRQGSGRRNTSCTNPAGYPGMIGMMLDAEL